jgi:hypothetical protein
VGFFFSSFFIFLFTSSLLFYKIVSIKREKDV